MASGHAAQLPHLGEVAGSRWDVHQVDIGPGCVASFVGGRPHSAGDASFDARFVVVQDGVPVREGCHGTAEEPPPDEVEGAAGHASWAAC